MALPVSFVVLTFNDNTLKPNGTPESASLSLPVITLTAGNLAAQQALHTTLFNAIDALSIGNRAKQETILDRSIVAVTASSDPLAQRENKYLVRFHGATLGQKFQISIPCADLSLHGTNSEFVDITADEGLALKNAMEACVRSPNDAAEAVVVDSIQFVGRNT